MLVETHLLTKTYGNLTALQDCSFLVPAGQTCGLLGPNGSGKTTLLRLLMGFLRSTSGTAKIAALDCYAQRVQVHRQVAYLPGEARLFRNMRGRAVLRFFSEVRPDGDFARSEEIAARLGLDLQRQVARCSTGMRQKLALAATLSLAAPLLILDEPTANLDPSVRAEVLALIGEAQRAGRTVLFSSHVLSEVEQVCDRVLMLRSGQLVHDQAMSDLRRQHRIHARLTGNLPTIPAELEGRLAVRAAGNGHVVFDAPGELAPMLGWLATLPVDEVRIEPIGLQTVYDRFHAKDPIAANGAIDTS